MRKDYDIVGSYDNQRVSTISAARTVNMFEYRDPEGKRPKVMLPTSGLVDASLDFQTETGGARAAFVFKDANQTSIYEVFGQSVFKTVGTTGLLSTTLIGTLSNTTGYVGIDANQTQVIFVNGINGYIYDTTVNTFEPITDTSFPSRPIDVCFLDGFFIVANGDTNSFQMSMINNGMVWGPSGDVVFTSSAATDLMTLTGTTNANFATGVPVQLSVSGGGVLPVAVPALTTSDTYYTIRVSSASTIPGTIRLARTQADALANNFINFTVDGVPTTMVTSLGQLQQGSITSHPGTIVACRTLHRRVFFFSQNFTEVWENAGIGTNLPIRRNNSLLMEVGTPAIGSVVTGFDRMFFLSQDKDGLGGVMEVKGTESVLVSNRALDYQLAQYASDPATGVADARGILIKENGIIFYRLNFTLANHTFVLNVTMSTSQEPMWHEEETLHGLRHPAQTHAYFDGVNYYGAYNEAKMFIVDSTVSNNNGEAIKRMRIGKQMTPEGYDRLRIDRFQVDLLQGAEDFIILDEVNLDAENSDDITTESGINLLLEQQVEVPGGQPVVFLSISKDGGQTYGNELIATMGKLGQRTYRTVWRKLGTTPRGQGFTPKIEFYNDVPFIVLGAAWDFEVLPE
jgi:hypothetical protein